jgi:hypothetical protein
MVGERPKEMEEAQGGNERRYYQNGYVPIKG